jgi:hypothetical protein
MSESIIINILLVIFLIVIGIIIFYILSLLIMLIISNCSAYIYEQVKKCCKSCDTFLQQEDHCDRCCKLSRVSIQHTNIIINEECPICITDNNSHSISLTCNHTYHSKCIKPWVQQCNILEKIPLCPLCNANIV